MKKINVLFAILVLLAVSGVVSNAHAQSGPVLYFCESYGDNGEVGISDRFTTGYLTVMVKASDALGLTNCSIQFDKYNPATKSFSFYKNFSYKVEPSMKYIFFSKNSTSDMKFDDPGIYRVYLLDDNKNTIASALIEIIP